ncbi:MULTISPECIES: aconitase X swivel domain-containing protein [Sinorhizobium]|uniref:Aconitase subunit 2 n=2 Tax=Sinorhizobium TaxID=28105 RepID=A0A2S3YSS6_9HYPH|nr:MULTISPECIES: DUF126 domain-containing protein [Sinorhizobium]ASY57670.1 2-Methylcitrate dehydratase AcnD [Sinorhizobium sp. CCBAU 05631]AUX77424.1 aconitase/3-isopropylmalate dehydratase domain-containing protein [Sinorhizobium fredii]PDT36193.1 DUF126 domain-containing protein [Sinorhizobium sp. FG01]PDT54131.1 DUF126 domain-containing protein [Sinorhizobium sp. NG07B]POH31189.1 aconitase subunit 2 [Sinorhizobium americanum]
MTVRLRATTLVAGSAAAETLVLSEPLSFWGGLDSASGRIIDQWHPQKNAVMSGRILVMRAGRGSSSGSSVLAEALRRGTGPAGIVLLARDAIVTVGAMVAAELYGKSCPVVLASEADWMAITGAGSLAIDTQDEAAIEI